MFNDKRNIKSYTVFFSRLETELAEYITVTFLFQIINKVIFEDILAKGREGDLNLLEQVKVYVIRLFTDRCQCLGECQL